MASAYRLVDVFAGCGGMTQGFEATGQFRSIFAVEWDEAAAETHDRNFAARVFAGPIEEVERFPKADILIGGPPCQGFSGLNMRRVGLDRRALWRHYLRALKQCAPSTFVMENVPGLLKSAEYEAFAAAAEELGFAVEGRILNSADYGVPQLRRRAIVLGSRWGSPVWPKQTHWSPTKVPIGGLPWRTFREAVAGLPLVPSGLNWHSPRKPRPESLERYRTIPNEGEGRFELAARRPDITPACWLRKKTGSTDVFGRLWWDRPAVTIRTEFYKPEKGRYLHPSEDRPITIREAARCMSFPDSFSFPDHQSMTEVAKQIGNAVPPVLATAIAEALLGQLEDSSRPRRRLALAA